MDAKTVAAGVAVAVTKPQDVSSAVTLASSTGLVFLGAFSLSDWAVAVGIALSVGTFLLNWIYKRRAYRLRVQEVEAFVAKLREQDGGSSKRDAEPDRTNERGYPTFPSRSGLVDE